MSSPNRVVRKSVAVNHKFKSDITGRKIEVAEPHLRIYNVYIEKKKLEKTTVVSVKKDEVEEIKKSLIERRNTENLNLERKAEERCQRCKDKDADFKITPNERSDTRIVLCEECVPKFIENIEKEIENIRKNVHYWDSIGINIRTNKKPHKEDLQDIIDRNNIREEMYITLIANNKNITTRINNVHRLINLIKEGEKSRCVQHKEEKKKCNCDFCEPNKKSRQCIEMVLCSECRNDIVSKLEKYVRENNKKIISQSI